MGNVMLYDVSSVGEAEKSNIIVAIAKVFAVEPLG